MRYSGGIALGSVLALAACAAPHNDVLIFGTNTKFAVDVSASAATGGVPELTVGYKRQEAVWMPLIVNARDSKVGGEIAKTLDHNYQSCKSAADQVSDPEDKQEALAACRADLAEGIKYVGTSGGSGSLNIETRSGAGTYNDRDAYSVFASFGATFGAEGGTGTAEAQGGIAQFFATGVAAQRLGANTAIGDALKVETTDARVVEAVQQRAEAREDLTEAQREIAQLKKGFDDRVSAHVNAIIQNLSVGDEIDDDRFQRFKDLFAERDEFQDLGGDGREFTPGPDDLEELRQSLSTFYEDYLPDLLHISQLAATGSDNN